jgi:osmoprotectant transport system ATP-binding protein
MIVAKNISKIYDQRKVVDNISFSVEEGKRLVLLGKSGCGKTTTLRLINRLIDASSGLITIDGKDITSQKPEMLRRNIGYVLQRNSLFPHYTVLENISVVPQLLHWDKDRIKKRAVELMEKFRLPVQLLDVFPNQLSGGEAQRVNLARALVANPSIVLMDEPFSALDNITKGAIRREFHELDELKRKTIVMVTHDVQEAFEIADEIILLDKGSIVQIGKPTDLLFKPVNDFAREFLQDGFIQLAFTVTTLRDIWSYLPSSQLADNITTYADVNDNVWKTVALLKDKNNENAVLAIKSADSDQLKVVSWIDILEAFATYQKRKINE